MDQWAIQQEIQELIREFPSRFIVLERARRKFVSGEQTLVYTTVFRGEAIVRPPTGTVNTYGLGQTENFNYVILIAGQADIQQGDFLRFSQELLPGMNASVRTFQVTQEPNMLGAFMQLTLEQYQQ